MLRIIIIIKFLKKRIQRKKIVKSKRNPYQNQNQIKNQNKPQEQNDNYRYNLLKNYNNISNNISRPVNDYSNLQNKSLYCSILSDEASQMIKNFAKRHGKKNTYINNINNQDDKERGRSKKNLKSTLPQNNEIKNNPNPVRSHHSFYGSKEYVPSEEYRNLNKNGNLYYKYPCTSEDCDIKKRIGNNYRLIEDQNYSENYGNNNCSQESDYIYNLYLNNHLQNNPNNNKRNASFNPMRREMANINERLYSL